MINFKEMVRLEEMRDVIIYLVGRGEKGISHPSLDQFFHLNNAEGKYESYNIRLIREAEDLMNKKIIISGYKKGPFWQTPQFVLEKKYGIE